MDAARKTVAANAAMRVAQLEFAGLTATCRVLVDSRKSSSFRLTACLPG
jgi:hypothetical protein